ncbi:FG-GAP repeat domain-containing protein [Halomarina salina]|uniref:FG-GAP repeat domain-containing protein n=1 Tax=Halomarina salina TaxID=1872699 RepID=A0ABD5RTI7_9EURY|nr:VCBS repeat-containing protein [Halomarina salina]
MQTPDHESTTGDALRFRHERVDDSPPVGLLSTCEPTDLTGNGRPDVIVSGLGARPELSVAGKRILVRELPGMEALFQRLETPVVWYENRGPGDWERHALTTDRDLHLDVGACLADIDGDGRTDFLVGQGYGRSDVYWFQQPEDPREEWRKFLVTDRFQKYHDLLVADVDDDGDEELIGLSQEAETVFYYDVPADPTVEPWPEANCHVVDEGVDLEGLWVGDIDGDGRSELVAGPHVYHRTDDGWEREVVADGWEKTRVAVADLDGDGEPELLLSEGDAPLYGTHPGRVGWFDYDGETWTEHLLADELYCPHSLQVGDLTGDGHQDVLVGEMAHRHNDDPVLYAFVNRGDGTFDRQVVAEGVETHEAKLVDVDGDGHLDVVSKSYGPRKHVDVWYNVD